MLFLQLLCSWNRKKTGQESEQKIEEERVEDLNSVDDSQNDRKERFFSEEDALENRVIGSDIGAFHYNPLNLAMSNRPEKNIRHIQIHQEPVEQNYPEKNIRHQEPVEQNYELSVFDHVTSNGRVHGVAGTTTATLSNYDDSIAVPGFADVQPIVGAHMSSPLVVDAVAPQIHRVHSNHNRVPEVTIPKMSSPAVPIAPPTLIKPLPVILEPPEMEPFDEEPETVEQTSQQNEETSLETNKGISFYDESISAGLASTPSKSVGYVFENNDHAKFRLEEEANGFIVGEFGILHFASGNLQGGRYGAIPSVDPRLIFRTLQKFIDLKPID